jgi:hypothetical protein
MDWGRGKMEKLNSYGKEYMRGFRDGLLAGLKEAVQTYVGTIDNIERPTDKGMEYLNSFLEVHGHPPQAPKLRPISKAVN